MASLTVSNERLGWAIERRCEDCGGKQEVWLQGDDASMFSNEVASFMASWRGVGTSYQEACLLAADAYVGTVLVHGNCVDVPTV